MAIWLVISVVLMWGVWWLRQPTTPGEFFQVRCATCHDLPNICSYALERRAGIVDVMRREHAADEVITPREAELIKEYLQRGGACP